MAARATIVNRLDQPELAFATLRALALVGGIVALLTVPPRVEHRVHHHILIGGFLLYKAALFSGLSWAPRRAQRLFFWAMPIDLALVFLLVWFTGGFESHAYLLFYLLIALNAYHYGFGLGVAGALAAVALYGLATWITGSLVGGWAHFASRGAVFALLGVSLGFLSDRERRARASWRRSTGIWHGRAAIYATPRIAWCGPSAWRPSGGCPPRSRTRSAIPWPR